MEKQNEQFVEPVILFDGFCRLCESSVAFIIPRDPKKVFHFAPLQSAYGQKALKSCDLSSEPTKSIVLIEEGRCFTRSTAALRIARRLKRPWSWFYGLILIPALFRDPIYDWVARNRYRWFGKRDSCLMPSPEIKERFLG